MRSTQPESGFAYPREQFQQMVEDTLAMARQMGASDAGAEVSEGVGLSVSVRLGELEVALQADITLAGLDIRNWDVALSSALLYLDTNEVVHLARGKAIFRAAMRIELNPEARRRQFSKADYAELALHYKDKIVQVHVMAEYARLAVRKVQAAMGFVIDYFSLERAEFVRRYFAGRKEILEIATTEAAHRSILGSLENPDQQAIVAAPLPQVDDAGWQLLTGQERRVLLGIGEGRTNKQIAAELYLSERTVEHYEASMLAKLGLRRRTQAVAYVTRLGPRVR